jgi:hypothetical protein
MREDTVTTTVYEFKELSEDVQEDVVEKYWDINVDNNWWDYECLLGLTESGHTELKKELTEKEIEFLNTKPLFNCTLKAFDIERDNFIQMDIRVQDDEIFRKFLGISEELWDNCYCEFFENGRYANTSMCITENGDDEFTIDDLEDVQMAEDIMNEKILSELQNLREHYEYLTSREAISEALEIHEFEFTKEGTIY